jgi:hypothetical protein
MLGGGLVSMVTVISKIKLGFEFQSRIHHRGFRGGRRAAEEQQW